MGGFRVAERPEHPDGTKYEFDCCVMPNVCWQGAAKASNAVCENCGYDWTEELP